MENSFTNNQNYTLSDYKFPKFRNYQSSQDVVDDYISMLNNLSHPYHTMVQSNIPIINPPNIQEYLSNIGMSNVYNSIPLEHLIDAAWARANIKATLKFQPLIDKTVAQNVQFGRPEDEVYLWDQDDVQSTCQNITHRNGNLFGCTEQDRIPDETRDFSIAYDRPPSRIFISKDWDENFIELAVDHELEHQAIITVGQMLYKHYHDFDNLGKWNVSKEYYFNLLQELDHIDKDLDISDKPIVDRITKKIYVDKRSNVYPKLQSIMDRFVKSYEVQKEQ